MEKPESSMGGGSMIELEDRDPNNLNQHLQVIFIIIINLFNRSNQGTRELLIEKKKKNLVRI